MAVGDDLTPASGTQQQETCNYQPVQGAPSAGVNVVEAAPGTHSATVNTGQPSDTVEPASSEAAQLPRSSSTTARADAAFTVAVLANEVPLRRVRVLVDPARPTWTSAEAWQRVYGERPLPAQLEWVYADGAWCCIGGGENVQAGKIC